MKINTLLVTALVLGTSSVALADTYSASFSWSFGAGSTATIRDHRTPNPTPVRRAPVRPTIRPINERPAYVRPLDVRPLPVRQVTTTRFPVANLSADRFERPRYERPTFQPPTYQPPTPDIALTGPTWDCHNWDPTVELDSPCSPFLTQARPISDHGAWIALGVRESAVPSHQYITVQRAFSTLRIQANTGAPELTKVNVKFTDGSYQLVNLDRRSVLNGTTIRLPRDGREINQIVMYSPDHARGTYAVYAK